MVDALLIERPFRESDRDFILASWLRSYRMSEMVHSIDKEIYYRGQNEIANAILDRSHTNIIASKEDTDTIIAYAIREHQWIHWIYTKQPFRRMGLARQLVGDPAKWTGYTHKSLISRKMKLPSTWIYDPYKALSP